MNRFKVLILSVVLLGLCTSFHINNISDKLEAQLKTYIDDNPSTNLYLHLDKNNYSTSDTIWFKAYVLAGSIIDNRVIYIRLTDQDNNIILKRQFMMYDIRAHGNLLIPETIKEGNYKLYAYTDRMINFDDKDVFVQPITIRREAEKMLEVEAFVSDTNQLVRAGKAQVLVRVKQGIHLLKNIKGYYQLLEDQKVLKSGKITTNTFGEASIYFEYPQLADDKILTLKANFKNKNEYADLLLNLHHEGNKLTINVYPEGGNLIAGVQSKMVVEVLNVNKSPVSTSLNLVQGKNVIAAVRTNKQGLAIINFIPKANETYLFQSSLSGKKISIPFTYPLRKNGYSLALKKVKDTTVATIKNKTEDTDALIVVRAYDRLIWSKIVAISPGDSLNVPLLLDNLPKTLLSIAVFDRSGNPCAERLFINKYDEDYQLDIKTDTKIYGQRKKVTVTFRASNSAGDPVATNLSVAVVEKESINSATYQSILHSYYYKALQGDLAAFVSNQSETALDALLITKKWWSTWQNTLSHISKKPRILENTDGLVGLIIQPVKGKFDVKNISLALKTSTIYQAFPVAEDHTFSIPAKSLLINDDQELFIRQSAEFQSKYQIVYFTPDRNFDKKVLAGESLFSPLIINSYSSKKPLTNPVSLKGIIQLNQVKIGGTGTPVQDFQAGTCTDFVCVLNILNCNNNHKAGSPGNFPPVVGGRYRYLNALVTYYGCDDYRLKSITIPKKFNSPDFEKDLLAEPRYGTTIFWEPNTGTAKGGTNTISFFTSDLTSDFTIIAQGIDTQTLSPLYGSASFSVK